MNPTPPLTIPHRLAAAGLGGMGLLTGCSGLVLAALWAFALFGDATLARWPAAVAAVVLGLVVLALWLASALIQGIAALAVVFRQPWGRWLGLVIGVLYLPSAFLPVGLLVIWGLWVDERPSHGGQIAGE